MKVSSTGGVSAGGGPRAKAAGGGGFSLPAAGAASGASGVAQTGGVGGVGSIDALLALQAVGDPLERRRRAVRRADRILDVLGEMKVALLDGELSAESLARLSRAVREQREATEDPGLEGVLNEIETRAAVELAKFEQSQRAR